MLSPATEMSKNNVQKIAGMMIKEKTNAAAQKPRPKRNPSEKVTRLLSGLAVFVSALSGLSDLSAFGFLSGASATKYHPVSFGPFQHQIGPFVDLFGRKAEFFFQHFGGRKGQLPRKRLETLFAISRWLRGFLFAAEAVAEFSFTCHVIIVAQEMVK